MICSQEKEERDFAISTIIKIRGKNTSGCTKPRSRKLPKLNIEATQHKDLIDWRGEKESNLSCSINKEEILLFK